MGFSIHKKLVIWFVFVSLLSLGLATLIGVHSIDTIVMDQAQDKVKSDLNTANEVYNYKKEKIRDLVRFTANLKLVQDALVNDDTDFLTYKLKRIMDDEGLDLLVITDSSGTVVARGQNDVCGDSQADDPLVMRALAGSTVVSTEIVPESKLLLEGEDLRERAAIAFVYTPKAKPTSKTSETSGMMIKSAAPIYHNDTLVGVIYGGHLINRNYEIVDRIKNIVYKDKVYGDRDIGTATIFQGDLRISTNVRESSGDRAIGTRVSEEVYNTVLVSGEKWIDRAYVVNAWYFTAYEPIYDINGNVIGILYVGMLEKPFTDIEQKMLTKFAAIILVAIILSFLIASVLAHNISEPITELLHTTRSIADGDLSKRVNVTRGDEIGELAVAFNRMADVLKKNAESIREKTAKLEHANIELKEIDRLKSEFINIASHELRTPLTTLKGYLELALDGTLGGFTDIQMTKLKIMNRNADRLLGLVNDLLNLSDIQSRQMHLIKKKTSLRDMLDDAIEHIKPLADSKGHEILVDIREDMVITCDRARIVYALRHLLDDAVRYTTEPGTIRITAEDKIDDVHICISDTGVGIPENELENIFIPFYELKGSMQHTTGTSGLGLSIAKGIVEAHGGVIWIKSKVGVGTIFHIVLPKG